MFVNLKLTIINCIVTHFGIAFTYITKTPSSTKMEPKNVENQLVGAVDFLQSGTSRKTKCTKNSYR